MNDRIRSAVVDPDRLLAVQATGLLDSPPDPEFDRWPRLVRTFLDADASMVTLLDGRRQFFKSADGLGEPWASRRETPLSHSFCTYVVARGDAVVVPDARRDPELCGSPGIEELGMVAYLGVPLRTRSGHVLGALDAIQHHPREWSPREVEVLRDLATGVSDRIELEGAERGGRSAVSRSTLVGVLENEAAGDGPADQLRLRTLTDAPVGIFRTRSDGRGLRANRTMARILGFESVEATLAHYSDLRHQLYVRPERRDQFLQELRERGYVKNFRYESRSVDGRTLWLEMNAHVAAYNPDGTFDIEGFVWDVTDRKRGEDALRHKQAMLERTERIAQVGSWEYDVASGVVSWSAELFRIFRLDPDAGAPSLEEGDRLFPPEDLERMQAAVEGAIEEGKPYDLDVGIRRADGTVGYARARGFPEQGPDGRVRHLHGSLQDITVDRQRREREAQLAGQLTQAQKMESVGRLAGGVAHDFNNMLAVIIGHVDLAQEKLAPDDPLQQDLAEVRRAAESSADLTRQLLAFAREQVVSPKVLDINETVPGMLKLLRRLIGADIELRWEPGEVVWPVRIDPVQIDQILANLLVNARDAIDGVGTITVETRCATLDPQAAAAHPDATPGDHVVLAVSDTGGGIHPSVLDRIFDPFFTTKPVGQGTGLGLATVYGIVRQNDGFIDVHSEAGVGTTLTLHFPRHEGSPAADDARPAVAERPAQAGDHTVLIVEDYPAVLDLSNTMLTRLGYRVLTAPTPRRALEIAGAHDDRIDLLITDVIMPGMNGQELAERLLQDHPGLGVLFMSGYPEEVIAERGVLDPGVNFVAKPFTARQLATKVREALAVR